MARQNSKYFSSVIEKLIADKHKENIVVDNSFKMSLREKVVARAGMMPQMEVSDSAETGGFAGFVNRWKYAFALVPSALLVMVVAAQVMNMPVEVESDVMGEVGNSKTQRNFENEESGNGLTVVEGELNTDGTAVDDGATTDGTPVKKIKTFPGALVMPVALTTEQDSELTTDQGVAQTSMLQGDVQSAPDTSKELRTFEVETSDAGGEVKPNDVAVSPNAGVDSGVSSAMADAVVPSYYPQTDVPDRTGSLDTNNYYESDSGATTYERTETSVRNDESLVVADKGDAIVAAPSGDGMGGGSDDSLVPTNDYATRNLVNPSLAVPLVMKNAELPVFNVSYETSLTSTEKTALETNAILPLTEGRDVQRVVVGRDANGYVSVIVFYGDGGSATSTYSFNSARGVWDKVTYIQPVSAISEFTYKTYKVVY